MWFQRPTDSGISPDSPFHVATSLSLSSPITDWAQESLLLNKVERQGQEAVLVKDTD